MPKMNYFWLLQLIVIGERCLSVLGIKKFLFPSKTAGLGTWEEGAAYCNALGATLVSIESQTDHNLLVVLFGEHNVSTTQNYFIGLHYFENSMEFKWRKNCSYHLFGGSFQMWNKISFNTTFEHCAILLPQEYFSWGHVSCNEAYKPICQEETTPDCEMQGSDLCIKQDLTYSGTEVVKASDCVAGCLQHDRCLNVEYEVFSLLDKDIITLDCYIYAPKTLIPYISPKYLETCTSGKVSALKICYNASLYDAVRMLDEKCALRITATTDSASINLTTLSGTVSTTISTLPDEQTTTTITTTLSVSNSTINSTLSVQITTSTNMSLTNVSLGSTPVFSANSCPCLCKTLPPKINISLEIEHIKQATKALQKELIVEKSSLSSYLSKKLCADDKRPSATGIGILLGIGILTFVIGLIVIPDVLKLIQYILKNVKKK